MEQILALPSLPHPSPKYFAVCPPAAQGMFICMDCGEQGLPKAGDTITGGQAAGSQGGMLCDPTIGNATGKQGRRQLEGEATVRGEPLLLEQTPQVRTERYRVTRKSVSRMWPGHHPTNAGKPSQPLFLSHFTR